VAGNLNGFTKLTCCAISAPKESNIVTDAYGEMCDKVNLGSLLQELGKITNMV
jgi:hypothetical protein